MAILSTLKLASMAMSVKGWIIKNWKLAIVLGLCGVIFYQNTMEFEILKPFGLRTIPGVYQEIDELKRDIDVLEQQLEECEGSRVRLAESIADTNRQVKEWFDISQDVQRENARIKQDIADLQNTTQQTVETILAEPAPETCEAAIQFLREAAIGDQQ